MTDRLAGRTAMGESPTLLPPRPWSVAMLQGKYYGTSVIDAAGDVVFSLWLTGGTPSSREDIEAEDVCDDHYETTRTLATAQAICNLVNAASRTGGQG